jgi:hypothetical protein
LRYSSSEEVEEVEERRIAIATAEEAEEELFIDI